MITRDVAQLRTVVAFDQVPTTATATDAGGRNAHKSSYTIVDASCGSLNGDSTANLLTGVIVDRLGLGRNYNSVDVSVSATADIGTTTKDAAFVAVSGQLWHSSTTCQDDFNELATGPRKPRAPVFLLNTTSTLASGYMATSTAVGTFGVFSATATGSGRADYDSHYDLTPAGRFLQLKPLVEAYASSSGGSMVPHLSASLVFGEPDEAPRTTTSTGATYRS